MFLWNPQKLLKFSETDKHFYVVYIWMVMDKDLLIVVAMVIDHMSSNSFN
jgi:hypothetical protein